MDEDEDEDGDDDEDDDGDDDGDDGGEDIIRGLDIEIWISNYLISMTWIEQFNFYSICMTFFIWDFEVRWFGILLILIQD